MRYREHTGTLVLDNEIRESRVQVRPVSRLFPRKAQASRLGQGQARLLTCGDGALLQSGYIREAGVISTVPAPFTASQITGEKNTGEATEHKYPNTQEYLAVKGTNANAHTHHYTYTHLVVVCVVVCVVLSTWETRSSGADSSQPSNGCKPTVHSPTVPVPTKRDQAVRMKANRPTCPQLPPHELPAAHP